MKRLFIRRRNRCLLCLATLLGVIAFLVWDLQHFDARAIGTPGPGYLVLWLGMVLLGIVALITLTASVIRARWQPGPRRSIEQRPMELPREVRLEHETPAAQLLPRV